MSTTPTPKAKREKLRLRPIPVRKTDAHATQPKRVRSGGQTTPAPKDKKPRSKATTGADLLMDAKINCAFQLSIRKYPHHEIAVEIGNKFNCQLPSRVTVTQWLSDYRTLINKETEEAKAERRQGQQDQIDAIYRELMPIALDKNIQVQREVTIDGQPAMIIDENAFKEKIKAIETIIKMMTREACLQGIDLADYKQAEGGMDFQAMQLWIISTLNARMEKPIAGKEVLELRAGTPALDEMEGK